MLAFVGVYLVILAVALIVVMYRDHMAGRVELLSVRNIAIVGFILFQLTSGAMSLFTNNFEPYYLNSPTGTALIYAAMCTVFLIIALWAYRKGWVATTLARAVPTTRAVPNDAGMLVMSALIMGLAAFLRLSGVSQIYLIGFVAGDVADGLAAVSAGLAGWVWVKRLTNPAVAFAAISITAIDMTLVMSETFGRRGLVAVGAGLLWGMYFSRWRGIPIGVLLRRLALISIGPILVVAAFTSVRESGEYNRTAGEQVRAILTGGRIGEGVVDLLGGQACAAGSMWLVESHRDATFEMRHMLTPVFFLVYPFPRILWENKPTPVGQLMPTMARMQGVERNKFNIGPGVIGTAGCEGGWYALVVYAILGGLFLRFFDEAIRLSPNSPFVILALGSALGHILGLARGEVSSFAALTVITVGGSLITMIFIGKLLESATGHSISVVDLDEGEDDQQSEWVDGEDRPFTDAEFAGEFVTASEASFDRPSGRTPPPGPAPAAG